MQFVGQINPAEKARYDGLKLLQFSLFHNKKYTKLKQNENFQQHLKFMGQKGESKIAKMLLFLTVKLIKLK